MACCVAVLSSTNGPLFVASSDSSDILADQYSLHTSLDVIEEKSNLWPGQSQSTSSPQVSFAAIPNVSSTAKRSTEHNRELYLGTLFATENQKVGKIQFLALNDIFNNLLCV